MGTEIPRMYTDAQREKIERHLWDVSQWVDFVECGTTRPARAQRLSQAPVLLRDDVRAQVTARHRLRRAA